MTSSGLRHDAIKRVANALRGAHSVAVLTGAGASAESGVPTFRDAQEGVWAQFDPTQLATPEAFDRDAALVARWYDERRVACAAVEPNAGHRALVDLERWLADRGADFTLLTQNVDRLHQKAGSRRVVELHGSLWDWRCVDCGETQEERDGPFAEHPPRCDDCGGARRPGVVWFGEMLPESAIAAAERAIEACDVFLTIGTSAVVYPAAGYAAAAKAHGAVVCEINRDETPVSNAVDVSIRAAFGQAMPTIAQRALESTAD